ncbi:DUF4350 domain-containing protein [Stenotrophomonas rhizophila]|uniref:DUF4350 domain-containing protein n=1 Tax=Stenotrophomonas rhizophila TaxID=216778 RepID=UPI001E3DEBE7|nr:DUF4350 domain-containing protein [Stenotrophomonas rhizophila]MCC7634447.1 DUF4350 domain-containing protein [Stenotrophomonas rhizophila]MCC7663845.1 DUF4350 domain-containing protein [Stenotrophomonas rhizophila]
MSTRLRWLLVGAVLLLVGVPAAIVFLRTHERVDEIEQLAPRGEASYNPLYVLGQALRADGISVQSQPRLDLASMPLQPHDTLVLLQDSADLPPHSAQALLAWVARGGHLLVRTPPAAPTDLDSNGPLLDALGVDARGHDSSCQPFHVADDPHHIEFCQGRRFVLAAPAGMRVAHRWGDDEDGLVFARLAHGQGSIDVLADMEFMKGQGRPAPADAPTGKTGRNIDGLHDKAHRDLTRYLLAPRYGQGTMWLVYASRPPSLWQRLFFQGWPVWVPLLLALLGWLWLRAQRMGSLLPSPAIERRSLLEHVRASGEHLLRYGKTPLLYDAVRRAFLGRLRRRAPAAAALAGDAQVHAIATLLHWPHARVQTALHAPASHDVAGLRERIRLLIQMRNLL